MIAAIFVLSLLLIISLVGNVMLYIAGNRQLKRVEVYESALNDFYEKCAIMLQTMRAIDSQQMFESDDEVGTVFNQLVEIVNELRPFVYGLEENDEEEV